MKKITNLLMLLAMVLFVACEKTIDTTEPTLEVKSHNLDGVWQLKELNGSSLANGSYVYLVLDRKYTYEIYQNVASMYPVMYSGDYELEYDWRVGDVISGTYDYGVGAWGHEYVITDLYKNSMVWTAKDDSTYVQRFVRIEKVPAEIVDAVRKDE
jgi:hypothetical protein